MIFDVSDLDAVPKKVAPKIQEDVKFDPNDIVKMSRSFYTFDNPFFTKERFPNGFVFYDFEVFKYDWLVVLIDPINGTKDLIVNDSVKLRKYYREHLKMIWTGYNNLHYDVPILKGILLGMNPKEISDKIIVEGVPVYEISKEFDKVELLSFDVMVHIANPPSLKTLEAFMGNSIEETEVPFDINRPLTVKEIQQTAKYCIHDVEQTIEVFMRRVNDFDSSMNLIEMFDLDLNCIAKTKGQLTALIVGCKRKEHDDEFSIRFVPTLKLDKYKYVQDWFKEISKMKDYKAELPNIPEYKDILSKGVQVRKNKNSKTAFVTNVCGVPHKFAWGGVHGAPEVPIHATGKLYHLDVTSFYPSLMIEYKMLTRNCEDPERFKNVYDTRVALKKAGKKKEQAPYKILLNAQYGITKDSHSSAFDPVQANNICINGQLLLLDLLEKLEVMGDHMKLLQSNTDGIIIWIDDEPKSEKWMRHICNEWIQRTKMGLGDDMLDRIIQKDVNNYVFVFHNDSPDSKLKLERKGVYVKELSDIDFDLPIVNEAIVRYVSEDIPVEDTINNCDEFIKFQMVFKVSKSYLYAMHNGKRYSEKTFRVFASRDVNDGYLGRCKEEGGNSDKFGNCPEHCFIWNKSVKDVPVPIKLDRKWYVDLAKKRLEDFGYEFKRKEQLF